ncbi:MAG: hypothetical protein HQM09_02530 [Candidatus Riflebacteria bacterium]|nr:hypothetical protein [Candidatus Riflebacteria bacterium]
MSQKHDTTFTQTAVRVATPRANEDDLGYEDTHDSTIPPDPPCDEESADESSDEQARIYAEVQEEIEKERQQAKSSHEAATDLPPRRIEEALYDNQDGDAKLFIHFFRGKYCYDHAAGRWHVYAGHSWAEDRMEAIQDGFPTLVNVYKREIFRVVDVLTGTKCDKDEEKKLTEYKKELFKRIKNLQSVSWREAVLKLARAGTDGLGITGDEWDQIPLLLGCRNGVVDLRDGSRRDGRPSDYIKKAVPHDWKGIDEPCPLWEKTQGEIHPLIPEDQTKGPDVAVIGYIQRLLGYGLSGTRRESAFPIFVGRGRNGKGITLEMLSIVLGGLAGPIQAEMLLSQSHTRSTAAPASDILALMGGRIIWASETDEGRKLNSSKMKQLTGNDTLSARAPYGRHEIRFKPTHVLILMTNNKPEVDAADYASWQRIHVVPFDVSFVDSPQEPFERRKNPKLMEQLEAEASGILAWLVRGCLEWQRVGLNPPAKVLMATKEYQSDQDWFNQFVGDRLEIKRDGKIRSSQAYAEFSNWGKPQNLKMTVNHFTERMVNKFGKSKHGNTGNFYMGVQLRPDDGK